MFYYLYFIIIFFFTLLYIYWLFVNVFLIHFIFKILSILAIDNNFSGDIITQTYENNKKKSMYTQAQSTPSSSSSSVFNKNGFSIPVQPRKNMDYQDNNLNNAPNENNSENMLLKQETNELRVKRKKFEYF